MVNRSYFCLIVFLFMFTALQSFAQAKLYILNEIVTYNGDKSSKKQYQLDLKFYVENYSKTKKDLFTIVNSEKEANKYLSFSLIEVTDKELILVMKLYDKIDINGILIQLKKPISEVEKTNLKKFLEGGRYCSLSYSTIIRYGEKTNLPSIIKEMVNTLDNYLGF